MTVTEFRRRCSGRRRMVRVACSTVHVCISSAQAEMLFRRTEGRIEVVAPPADGLGAEAYAWIYVPPADGLEKLAP